MPRKTRVLHDDDEYLFVEAPGDPDGPALLVFARPDNARAVPPGRHATHQTEHGLWCQVARFDGEQLLIAPEPPDGMVERLKAILPRYVQLRRERAAQAKNVCFYVVVDGSALHALHVAQPAGLVLKLWTKEEKAYEVLAASGVTGAVQTTGDLKEFLELRAEEGFAGALIDDEQVVYFCIDPESHARFVKVSASDEPGRSTDLVSHLLDEKGRWAIYEGDEALEPFIDQDVWDRLMVRTFGRVPFVGWNEHWSCFVLIDDEGPVVLRDPDDEDKMLVLPLFHDPKAGEAYRLKNQLTGAALERVEDLPELLRQTGTRGACARLQPGDHRARGGTLWLAGDMVVLDSFSGLWKSPDGASFTFVE